MLNVVISFDYELFLGENFYNNKAVLFDPTDRIIDILEQNKTSATFFADVCSVFQHNKYGLTDYSSQFEAQICKLDRKGCDVQLHIHPNWLRSFYNGGRWEFDIESYRIHFFDNESDRLWSMSKIIEEGAGYLNEVLSKNNPNYKCVAYRAGGFAIQPHSKLFSILQKNGIRIDSSVVVNDYLDRDVTGYDFRNTPKELNWWVSSDNLMEESNTNRRAGEGIYEVPVMTTKNSIIERLMPSEKRFYKAGKPNGKPISIELPKENSVIRKIKKVLTYNSSYRRLSLDAMNYEYLHKKVMDTYERYNAKDNEVFISLIGHPKAFTGDAFDNLNRFIRTISKEQDRIRLLNMRDVYREIVEKYDKD